MALIANNISGSVNNFSRVGITGSVIIANRPGSNFPQIPGPDVTFFVSGSGDGTGKSVFGGDLISSSSFNLKNSLNGISQFSVSSTGMSISDSSGIPKVQIVSSTGDITTSGNLIIKSHSGYTGSELVTLTSAVTTSDSTPTTVYTLPLSDNHVYWVEASIIGNQSDNTNRAYYVRQCLAYRAGAGASIQTGVIDDVTVESNASWDSSMTNSGNDILIYVVGVDSTTVYWTATIRYQAISTSS